MAGEDLTSKSVPTSFKRNAGGLNSTGSPLVLRDDESSDLQNMDFDRFGSPLQRKGYATLNSSAFNSGATWNSLHWYQLVSGTDFLIGTCGDKLGKMDDLDGTWDDITGGLTITAGDNNHMSWVTFRDTAAGTNGVDVPIKWTSSGNGAALTVPTDLTKAKYNSVLFGFHFLANVTVSGTAHPTRIYWSNLNEVETWTDTDFTHVQRDDGQDITGLRVLGESIVIFKERSIYIGQFTGDADIPFIFPRTNSHVGAVAGHAILELDNGLVFFTTDGWYFFDGNNSFKMSDRITNTLDKFNDNRFENPIGTEPKV